METDTSKLKMVDGSEEFAIISVPYLFVLHIPYFIDALGRTISYRMESQYARS